MHTPRAFVETDLVLLDDLLERDPFVTVVTVDDGLPRATALPVLYRREGDRIVVEGHWSRANPQSRHQGDALLIIHGPHAYVSPAWYPDKQEQARVPTWNYAMAQLQGRLETIDGEDDKIDLLARLSAHFEAGAGSDWRFDPADPRERMQVRGIVGFRFLPTRIDIKHKLNQNHPLPNRESVASKLAASGIEREREIAAMMRASFHDTSRED